MSIVNNSVISINKNHCSGCGLCAEKCPKSCIKMLVNEEGFLVPVIDQSACVNCGICLKSCTATNAVDNLFYSAERKFFCAIINDEILLKKSSSGGIFGIIAERYIKNGGFVCGCVYNEKIEAVHILTNKIKDIERMYGSKYVQSKAYPCFKEIKVLLDQSKEILFVGTACQIAGLRNYLEKDYKGLLCVEILCHGVPSPKLFADYVAHLEKKLGGKVLDVQFRNKEKHGWGSEHRTCVFYLKGGKVKKYRPVLPAYFSAFFYGLNLRESCYKCRYAKSERIADLTIGDFWGAFAKYGKRFNEGISVVSINSEKGNNVISAVREKFKFYDELTESEAVKSNDNFEHPIKRPKERDDFYKGVYKKGYKGLWKKTYFTKTYRKKTLASIYGAFVPAKIRFALHRKKGK